MTVSVNINITLGADQKEYTAHEASILQALAGGKLPASQIDMTGITLPTLSGSAEVAPAQEAPAEETPAEEAPAKPARKRTSRAKPKAEEAPTSTGPAALEDFAPDQDDAADEADLLGGDEEEAPAAPEYTVKDALDKATLVLRGSGGRAKVSEALAQTKAPKVSALDGDDIAVFIAALEG